MTIEDKKKLTAQLLQLERSLRRLYGASYAQVLQLAQVRQAIDNGDSEFTWERYPAAKKQLDNILSKLSTDTSNIITKGTISAQKTAVDGKKHIGASLVSTKQEEGVMDDIRKDAVNEQRKKGMESARKRGVDISKRVWNYNDSSKTEIEIMIQQGIMQGKSADDMTKDIRKYLNNPDTLFRRVRNKETGNLELSEAAKNYHPGQGLYRSAYKNAMRLARTEVNMAYLEAEWQMYQNDPTIVAYEVKLSNNHTTKDNSEEGRHRLVDICDQLQGRYPKTFKFVGWHPQCRCNMVPVFIGDKEFSEMCQSKRDGKFDEWKDKSEERHRRDVPEGFKKWVEKNKGRIEDAQNDGKSVPYFIKDNYKDGDVDKGLAFEVAENVRSLQYILNSNLDEVADAINVSVGKPMDFDKANEMRGNPHFESGSGNEYTVNCQSCVVANELRRRGLDVEAMGNTKRKGNGPSELSCKTEVVWIDPKTGKTPVKTSIYDITDSFGKTHEEKFNYFKSKLDDATSDIGRYHIDWQWRGGNSGHIVTIERLSDGSLRMYDPQIGKVRTIDISFFGKIVPYSVRVLRVDNLKVEPKMASRVVAKKGTTKPSKKNAEDNLWSKCNTYYNKLKKSGLSDDEIFNLMKKYNHNDMVEKYKIYRKGREERGLKGFVGEDAQTKKHIAGKDKYGGYDGRIYNNVYKNDKSTGYVVEEKARLEQAKKSKNEMAKYKKEKGVSIDLADKGHKVVLVDDHSLTDGSYDAFVDGKRADFKILEGYNGIEKHAWKAIKKQNAEIVVFSLPRIDSNAIRELHKLTNKDMHGFCIDRSTKEILEF